MTKFRSIAILVALMTVASPVQAADFEDPTWPCVQRKVETLSLGLMWPFPVDPQARPQSGQMGADIAELAGYLALRRVDLDSAQPRIDAFAVTYNGDPDVLGLVFAAVFDRLATRRTRIISGIEKFSLNQIALAEQIESVRVQMNTLMAADTPDFDKVDVLEEQLDWDQVIYTDRQRNITYLCETPTLLERRLFSIAQLLQQSVRDPG